MVGLRSSALAALLLVACQAANAASFDLFRPSGSANASAFTFTDGGVTLSVTGGTFDGGDAPLGNPVFGSVVHQSIWGLSVDRGGSDSHELDGDGPDEFLRFAFSAPVVLQSVIFTAVDGNDNFDMGIGGTDIGVIGSLGSDLLADLPEGPLSLGTTDRIASFGRVQFRPAGQTPFMAAPLGSFFDFYVNGSNDDYKIARITVSIPSSISSDVPLPPAAALLLGALAGLGLMGRRRNSPL